MIWVPATEDENAQLLTIEGVVHGVVRFMPKVPRYIASTNKLYLGGYKTLKNAQTAVEAKVAFEHKQAGKML